MITRFSELIDEVLQSEPAKVAVAAAQDDAVLMACQMASNKDWRVSPCLATRRR